MTATRERYVSAVRLAKAIGWHPEAIRRWARDGLVRCKRVRRRGSDIHVSLDSVEEYLRRREAELPMAGLRGSGKPPKDRVTVTEGLRRLRELREKINATS